MIAAWMFSAVLVGALVTAGAIVGDHVLTALRRSTRFLWLSAMVVTLAWPALAYWRATRAAAAHAVPPAPLTAGVQRMTSIVVSASEQSLHMSADVLLGVAWLALSAALFTRMWLSMRALRRRGRTWRAASVDGVDIELSADVGPAVVGLSPMKVVLPEWTLELEPQLRAVILAHEDEHRRARDPHLLVLSAVLADLVPWNPALWWQARRLRLAIELDCDARVLRAHPRADRYGLLLLAIAQRRTAGVTPLVTALSEPTSNLERRINAMQIPVKRESRVRLAALGAAAIVVVAIACSVDAPTSPHDGVAVLPETTRLVEIRQGPTDKIRFVGDSIVYTPAVVPYHEVKVKYDEMKVKFEEGNVEYLRDKLTDSSRLASAALRDEAAEVLRGFAYKRPTKVEPDGPIVEAGHVTAPPVRSAPNQALYEFRLAKPAQWISGTGMPVYPPALKTAGVDGEVEASFVVEVSGRVDVGSFKVIRSSNPEFTEAVRTALSLMRYSPAEADDHRAVRQIVRQKFSFSTKG